MVCRNYCLFFSYCRDVSVAVVKASYCVARETAPQQYCEGEIVKTHLPKVAEIHSRKQDEFRYIRLTTNTMADGIDAESVEAKNQNIYCENNWTVHGTKGHATARISVTRMVAGFSIVVDITERLNNLNQLLQ